MAKVNRAVKTSSDKAEASRDEDEDETMFLMKRTTARQDEDYAKTVDECLHVKLTKHHFEACGAEKPEHKSTLAKSCCCVGICPATPHALLTAGISANTTSFSHFSQHAPGSTDAGCCLV